jgi:hypothetical protein
MLLNGDSNNMKATVFSAIRVLTPTAIFGVSDDSYAGINWLSPDIPQPTEQEVNDEIIRQDIAIPFADCKAQATRLLYETDWTTIADVADPTKSQPYLLNQADFTAYRSALRQLAVYPEANPVWPVKPTEQWSSI